MRESWGEWSLFAKRSENCLDFAYIKSDYIKWFGKVDTLIHLFLWKVFVDHVIGRTKSRCSPTPWHREKRTSFCYTAGITNMETPKKLIVLLMMFICSGCILVRGVVLLLNWNCLLVVMLFCCYVMTRSQEQPVAVNIRSLRYQSPTCSWPFLHFLHWSPIQVSEKNSIPFHFNYTAAFIS